MEYVVTSERLKTYLYSLGFCYREVPDRTKRQKKVWLFPNDKSLIDAITFFTDNKRRMANTVGLVR